MPGVCVSLQQIVEGLHDETEKMFIFDIIIKLHDLGAGMQACSDHEKCRFFLAHPSRRFTRWAYSIPMVCRLSSSTLSNFNISKANLDQILCVASLGWGKGCIRIWGRLDQNSGYHGNRKPPLTYNGENDVSTFSRLLLIRSFSYLQVTITCIKSRTSSNFGQIGPLTTELAALECLKNFP